MMRFMSMLPSLIPGMDFDYDAGGRPQRSARRNANERRFRNRQAFARRSFGATVRLAKPLAQEMPEGLPQALAEAGGLLLIPGLGEIAGDPAAGEAQPPFGPEVEDYRTR